MSTATLQETQPSVVPVIHVVKGQVQRETEVEFKQASGLRFATPSIHIDSLTWPRRGLLPASNMPIDEIIDFLVAVGDELERDQQGYMSNALENMSKACTLERRIIANGFGDLPGLFTRRTMEFVIQQELGGKDVLDGWREVMRPNGRVARTRAFPPRLIHILPGNTPLAAGQAILFGSLTKGVHLLKMPSNDLFSASAILQTMVSLDREHPLVQSFSAVYWRGGDASVESQICRPQYFDKLVAWGGEEAIRGAKKYAGPGFDLITFDPKTSISLIGGEIFESEATLAQAAELAAIDATPFNQGACTSSRFQFIEGSIEDIDRYCEALQANLGKDRHSASAIAGRVPLEVREEIEGLRGLEPEYRVWGGYEGKGIVIRSSEPVDFHPDGKIVNVVPVPSLQDAVAFATVATSTVGVFPFSRKIEVRDLLAAQGVQRVINLGQAMGKGVGIPHDGFWPLNRYMRWVNDED
jgi:Acyl-CoA reductase (LuxC)